MTIDFDSLFKEMAEAARQAVKDDLPNFAGYAEQLLDNEKESLKDLAKARLEGVIDEATLAAELAREKRVLEAELLTAQIMAKTSAQKAVNAALEVFYNSLRAAL
ncbi:hypothetical protein [Marinobacterium arenosum]|uniref:hypothetical protein n=1 Tax=Marinobacterium arenosum TaxID=2862496 RepID=UPI001C96AC9E|nr:hypothetical protein [Marinobacterium arenosum]MBY4675797.1 hypothetical protein [Marinobacterium arenosum]